VAATRRLAAIMFTDTVGYTASTQADEAHTLQSLREQEELVRPLISAHHGREIKSTGDGFLVEFDSALKATHCAVDIQRRIYDRNAEGGLPPIRIRIGIHLGDVVQNGADILGDAVNIAARIEPVAEPGGICLSAAVREQVWNKITDKLEKLPPTALKGVQVPMEIYRVVLPWTVGAPSAADSAPTGLAVLPFSNISPDPKDEYFADGLTEELISILSQLRGLRVIARTSVMQYKATSKAVSQIGGELRVSSILEGSVRKAGNRLRVTAQLIDVESEGHVWSDTYDRELDDIFAVQREIADRVASSLKVRLLDGEMRRMKMGGRGNAEAYTLLLKGRFHLHRWERASAELAIKYFEEAIARDPGYAAAYADLGKAYAVLRYFDVDPTTTYPKAEEYVLRALELDDSSAEAHVARAIILWSKYEFAARDKELERALELNPNSAEAHLLLSDGWSLMGRREDALREVEKALELDPLSEETAGNAGTAYLYAGDYDRAIRHLEDALELDPKNMFFLENLGLAHVQKGLIREGLEEVKRAADTLGPTSLRDLAYAYVKAGKLEEARGLLTKALRSNEVSRARSVTIGGIYAVLGDTENALQWLERAYDERSGYLPSIGTDFVFDSLRGDPRFRSLLQKMNLTRPVSS